MNGMPMKGDEVGRIERTVMTSAVLGQANRVFLERATAGGLGRRADTMASLLFTAFTFEAVLNHVGAKIVPYWRELDRLPWKSKLNVLLHYLKLHVDGHLFGRQVAEYGYKSYP
jgi:hypothetical protein